MENELSRTCSTHGRDEKCVHNSDRKSEGKGILGRHNVNERIIFKWMLKI
jgi:hypothetical protein